MSEIQQREMRVGFLLQPNSATTPGIGNPVGTYTAGTRWNNPQDTSAVYYEMLATVGNIVPNSEVENYNLNSVGSNTIFMEQDRAKTNSKSVLPSIDLEMYATPNVLSGIFGIALQDFSNNDPATGSIGQQIKPYDNTIDFQTEGFLMTVAGGGINKDVSTSDGFILHNAVVNTMTITFENVSGGEERLAKITCQLVGTSCLENQYFTSAWTPAEEYVYNQSEIEEDYFTLDLTVGVNVYTNICWRKVEISINNNITSDCFTSEGASNLKRSNPTITSMVDIPHNDTTVTTFRQYKDGVPVSYVFQNGYIYGESGYNLEFDIKAAKLNANPRSTSGDYIAQSLSMDVLRPTAGWGDFMVRVDTNTEWETLPSS